MARSIAADLAPRNIRVNVVAPGATKTPIWNRGPRASLSADESAKLAKAMSSKIPLGRWGEPEDLAKAVLFLASDDSSYIMPSSLWSMEAQRAHRGEPPFFMTNLETRA